MKHTRLLLALLWGLQLCACGGTTQVAGDTIGDGSVGPDLIADAQAADVALDLDAVETLGADTLGVDTSGSDRWAALTARIADEMSSGKISGGFAALDVYLGDGTLVYSEAFGDGRDRTSNLAVASASKWITSTVLLMLVADKTIGLDDTTATWLGWTGQEGTITLRQLLSFTSGLEEHACTAQPGLTIAECVAKIQSAGVAATPGSTFHYHSAHMAVAARLAEVASGESWGTLFAERLKTPLGFGDDVAYYTAPKLKVGTSNPLVAGGLRISMAQYGVFLTALQGLGTQTLLPSPLFLEQVKEQWAPQTTVSSSPNPPNHYALGCWRECPTPNDIATCNTDLMIHSGGSFGFIPIIDTKNKFYAVFGAEGDSGSSQYNGHLVIDALRPLIVEALKE